MPIVIPLLQNSLLIRLWLRVGSGTRMRGPVDDLRSNLTLIPSFPTMLFTSLLDDWWIFWGKLCVFSGSWEMKRKARGARWVIEVVDI